jgi:hypothetical protein
MYKTPGELRAELPSDQLVVPLSQGDVLDNCPLVCRLATPYREHLAQHFSVTYSRIGLPEPYGTSD